MTEEHDLCIYHADWHVILKGARFCPRCGMKIREK